MSVSPMAIAGIVGAAFVLALLVWLLRRRPRLIRDWRDAEVAAAAWLRAQGCRGVELTTAGADAGIDILTETWAVQVKHRSSPTGRPAIQQIVGAALDVERLPAVVSTSGFTAPAVTYASDHQVALVELDLTGRADPVTSSARDIGRVRLKKRTLVRRWHRSR